jgi:hypothetical protein
VVVSTTSELARTCDPECALLVVNEMIFKSI